MSGPVRRTPGRTVSRSGRPPGRIPATPQRRPGHRAARPRMIRPGPGWPRDRTS